MREFIMDKKQREINARAFYSTCRKFEEFNEVNNNLNKYIELYNNIYQKDNNGTYYYRLLKELRKQVFKKNFSDEEALYILINVIDENLDMYKIYETFCRKNIIINEAKEKFGFYDEKLVNIEKKYINAYCNIQEYDFTKKLELF